MLAVTLVVLGALMAPLLPVLRACFCDHGDGRAGHEEAGCSCPLHADGNASALEGAHCHRGAAADPSRCSLSSGQPVSADLLAALSVLLRPAIFPALSAAPVPQVAGRVEPAGVPMAAAADPSPPTPPPRSSSRLA